MIKGPLGLMVWADTMSDPTTIKPTDLILLDQQVSEAKVVSVAKQEEEPVLILKAA